MTLGRKRYHEAAMIRKLQIILRRGDEKAKKAVEVVLNHHFFRLEKIKREKLPPERENHISGLRPS
jgi:hypothetical protein